MSLRGRNLEQLPDVVPLSNTNGEHLNSKSLQRKRRTTHTVLGTTIGHYNHNLLSAFAAASEQRLPGEVQGPSCFSTTPWVPYVINSPEDVLLGCIPIEAKYSTRLIGEQYYPNTSEYLGYFERYNHSFNKVETPFEISLALRLNASRPVEEK